LTILTQNVILFIPAFISINSLKYYTSPHLEGLHKDKELCSWISSRSLFLLNG